MYGPGKGGHGFSKVSLGLCIRFRGERLLAVFYPFKHPTRYAYGDEGIKEVHGMERGRSVAVRREGKDRE
jgi:hypothetical protein